MLRAGQAESGGGSKHQSVKQAVADIRFRSKSGMRATHDDAAETHKEHCPVHAQALLSELLAKLPQTFRKE